jgi:hypothetical protein
MAIASVSAPAPSRASDGQRPWSSTATVERRTACSAVVLCADEKHTPIPLNTCDGGCRPDVLASASRQTLRRATFAVKPSPTTASALTRHMPMNCAALSNAAVHSALSAVAIAAPITLDNA